MSNAAKITLEARVKLPPKVQDVVCDASLIASHAVAAANSSEMLNSCLKATASLDQTNDTFTKVLNMMNDDADVLNQYVKEAFERASTLSDINEKLQAFERSGYFTESPTPSANIESDVESMGDGQILSLRDLLMRSGESGKSSRDAEFMEQLCLEKMSDEEQEEATASEDTLAEKADDDSREEDMEVVKTPPPSPTGGSKVRPSLFSLAQVSSKLGELWSSAKESLFGEDYWIPKDPYEIVFFPPELLRAHPIVFPSDDIDCVLRIARGSLKNRPTEPLHHLVFSVSDTANAPSYSVFRSHELEEAEDLCSRCLDCKLLFTTLDASNDIRKPICEIIQTLKQYPLYKMIHIAIACNREDIFTDANVDFMDKNAIPFNSLMRIVAHPEGKHPLHLAIEMHRLKMVRRMLELGADPCARDFAGNTTLHYASLASVQMLELLWEFDESHPLLNATNNEGYSPVMIAIRAANPRCLATLIGFGAEVNVRVQGRNVLFEAVQSKGKSTEIIRAIIEASPELVNEVDSSGNTVLHAALYKTPLMGLLLLKNTDIDLNVKNNAGQAPLHIYTHKGDIGLIITLSSYRCDINVTDSDGNTALHIAVSKRNLEATRLLLCLGADPNIQNDHGDTARHLAARLKETQLLKSLILCGGRRCEAKKGGCVSGCAHETMLGLMKSASFLDNESPRSSHAVLAAETDSDVVDAEHPIRDYTQKIYYEALINRMEELASRGERPKNMVNLLSMDGGGIRGLVIIQMLMAMEEHLGESIYPYFDWVAGTSTGALVATALAQGKTLRECQHIYLRFKDLIFDGWTRPFNSAVLESFMKEQMGDDNLSEIRYPRLMISTVKADFFPVKLEFMRNYRLPVSEEENEQLGFTDPNDVPIWKAMRRTSAAPMFFSPVDNKYIDGGICANNPTLDLLAEVELYNGTNAYLKREEENVEVGCVLSLGTGQIPLTPMDPLHVEYNKPLSSAYAVLNLSLILIDQVTATEGAPVDRGRSWCNAIGKPFFRLSAPLHKEISLAAKDDHVIAAMMWDCIEYTHQMKPYITKLCTLLKKIGKHPNREVVFNNGKTREMQTQTSQPSTPMV